MATPEESEVSELHSSGSLKYLLGVEKPPPQNSKMLKRIQSQRALQPEEGILLVLGLPWLELLLVLSLPGEEEPLVRPNLELLTALLIDVRSAKYSVLVDRRRQRDGSRYFGAGPPRDVDDLGRRLIEQFVVVGLEPDTNFLAGRHRLIPA